MECMDLQAFRRDKRIVKTLVAVVLCLVLGLTFTSCKKNNQPVPGVSLKLLRIETINYNGGYTETYVFDFENNDVKRRAYVPGIGSEPDFSQIAVFSEDEEAVLIDKLSKYGLFEIEDDYPSPPGIMDGGGWKMTIVFSDGTTKESKGSNNSPASVFSSCAKAFYDICSDGIVAYVPQEYYLPPNVSYSFRNGKNSMSYECYGEIVAYKWNGFESEGKDVYSINESASFYQEFSERSKCSLVLYTGNYHNYAKFKKCIVTSYDYNRSLSNPSVVYDGTWFSQIEFDLQLNKIYVVRLEFDNGDFAEYTFNTRAKQ